MSEDHKTGALKIIRRSGANGCEKRVGDEP
jgi:hypothetical protein